MGIHMKNNINYTGATSLNTLRDVAIDSPATGQGIVWDEETQMWTNGEVSTNDMVEITLAEYEALSTEEKNNDTTYFITDADNIDPGNVGTAGTLKPWLYDSDEEVVIGVYDGKPLYRKVFKNLTPVNKTDTFLTFEHGIENVDYISINPARSYVEGVNFNENPATYPINFISPSNSTGSWTGIVDTIYINLYTGIDRSAIISNIVFTIEYTKTTDAEGSGTNLMPYSFVQNASNNYSTEEQVVGRWIDGKPLYQKTIIAEITEVGNSALSDISDLSFDMLMIIHSIMVGNGGYIPSGYKTAQSDIYFSTYARNTDNTLRVVVSPEDFVGRTVYTTIQYTKTMD